MNLSRTHLDQVFDALKEKRFAVLGDYCLDAYYFLAKEFSEVSIETRLRTVAVGDTVFNMGGAGNVVANLTAMGAAHVHALGVLGDDLFGREYLRLLSRQGADTDGVVIQSEDWQTYVYTKLYNAEKELPRIDIGRTNELTAASAEMLLANLTHLLPRVDIVLINQQLQNGVHGPLLKKGLQELIHTHGDVIWLLDARDLIDSYPGTIRKLNQMEAVKTAGLDHLNLDADDETTIDRAAEILYQRWGTPLCITRGSRGGVCRDGSGSYLAPALHFTTKLDTVGAGDTILAGLAAGLSAGLTLPEAFDFATLGAGITIRKQFQTGTVSEAEIRALARDPDFRYRPELAAAPERAVFHGPSEIELVAEIPRCQAIRYALFDHDGTISTLREGWEGVMAPMMIGAILGHDVFPNPVQSDLYSLVKAEVERFIDQTTGIRTLTQMEGLIGLIKEQGLVPEDQILEPIAYKRMFSNELRRIVDQRLAGLRYGERETADFTINGAVAFLKELRRRGVKLFLASGTDETHLWSEATALGYAELFDGGIHGAWDHSAQEPKKMVLEKILTQMGTTADGGLITFGDGPVEIRESLKRGGVCVGIASDEIRRYGLNLAKRKRLILSGAHFVVPDFSQGGQLLELLFPHS